MVTDSASQPLVAASGGSATLILGEFPPLIQFGLLTAFRAEPALRVAAVGLADTELTSVAAQLGAAVAVLDASTATKFFAALRATSSTQSLAFVFLTHAPSDYHGQITLAVGGTCVDLRASVDALLAAILMAAQGQSSFVNAEGRAIVSSALRASDRLTVREIDVLGLLCEAHPQAAIAIQLGITHATVRQHAMRIRAKIGRPGRERIWPTMFTHNRE